MLNDYDKKVYGVAKVLVAILTFIVFKIMFINEDASWNFLPFVFAFAGYVACLPGVKVSKKIIDYSNSITITLLRILFFFPVLPVGIFLLSIGIYLLLTSASYIFISGLGEALLALGLVAICVLFIAVPYILSIMYLIAKVFVREK